MIKIKWVSKPNRNGTGEYHFGKIQTFIQKKYFIEPV